ncbi:Domain of unkown function [Blastococcus aggregatus]|uniref:Domain of unkown function n=1 Tax=Blastococcus aggregatus TaxID=38502 RepID=A0A285V4T1_9ACTN|nr:DUF1775 domain-containing protein [Blastococcus aggregatus]SOC48947.1 Domain of unkown function [Blastococcus aggregatus]
MWNSTVVRDDFYDMRVRALFGVPPMAVALVLAVAAPAFAHVEVTAGGAEAGDPATLRFSAAAEHPSSGIVEVATRFPRGMPGDGLVLESGPPGWRLTVADDVVTVGGKPLPVGRDAEYSIAVPALPTTDGELLLPTVQRYADGREDAWIEPATAAVPDPAMPAPVLVLGVGRGAGDAESDRGPVAVPSDRADSRSGAGAAWYAAATALGVLALAGGTVFWRRLAGRAER